MINIILVDDESGQLEIMKNIILELYSNFHIMCFDNSLKALNYISSNPVDAVITDIKMPRLSGLNLTKEISLLNRDIIVAIISAYNDFEYAQKAISYGVISYLIKPISHSKIMELFDKINEQIAEKEAHKEHMNSLNSQLKAYKPAYTERQFKAWLNGTASTSELTLIQSIFKYSGDGIVVATQLNIVSINSTTFSLSDLISFIKINIHKLFSLDKTVLSVINNEEKLILVNVIVAENYLSLDLVLNSFYMLSQEVKVEYGIDIYSGASEIVPDIISNLQFYVKQSLDALDYTFLNSTSRFLAHKDIQNMQLLDSADLYTFQNKILDRFYLYDANGIKEILETFNKTYVNNGYIMPSNILRQHFINIVFLANKHIKHQPKDNIIDKFKNCHFIEALTALIYDHLNNLMAIQHKKADEATQQVISSMKSYIDSHFYENLNLDLMAANMHFNPNYIGSLFKQQFGIGFKDYVIKIRINKAKQLLTDTNLKIYEIAKKVGYSDVAYFIKIFKKNRRYSR